MLGCVARLDGCVLALYDYLLRGGHGHRLSMYWTKVLEP